MQKKKKDLIPESQNEEIKVNEELDSAESEVEELLDQLSENADADDDGVYRLNTLSFDGEQEGDKKKNKTKKAAAKRFGMVKKQQIMLIAFAIITVTLTLLYFLVFKNDYEDAVIEDTTSTVQKDPLPLLDGEAYDEDGVTTLLYPKIDQSNLQNIKVENQYGTYNVAYFYDEETKRGGYYIVEHPVMELETANLTSMTSILTEACYTPINERVVDNCEDFSIYGLVETTDENGNVTKPARITVTTKSGETHVFYIGDLIPGSGYYYCRVEGRNAVYTVPTSASEFLVSAENHLTPQLGPVNVGTSESFSVDELIIRKNGEPFVMLESREFVRARLIEELKALRDSTDLGISDELKTAINSYLDNDSTERLNALISALDKQKDISQVKSILDSKDFLYTMENTFLISNYKINYPSGYVVDDDNVGNKLLAALNSLQGSYVVAAGDGKTPLWANDAVMQRYGFYDLENPMFELFYKYGDEEGYIIFGDSGSDVYYFAYAYNWDMIVMIEKETVPFVDWDLLNYVSLYPFQDYIGDVSQISVSASKLYYKGQYYSIDQTFKYWYLIDYDEEGEETNRVLNCLAVNTGTATAGNTVTKNPIQALYNVALKIKIIGYAAEENFDLANKEEYARMTVTYHSNITREYVFYRFGGYCYFEIDGAPGMFYTSVKTVNKLLIDSVRAAYEGNTVNPEDEYADLPDAYIRINGSN